MSYEDKLCKFLFQKSVYQTGTGRPSHDESVPRSSSEFQKVWWPCLEPHR